MFVSSIWYSSPFPPRSLFFSQGTHKTLPKIDARNSLVDVGGINPADATLGEPNADEGRIIPAGPVLDGERQRIRVMGRRIRELQVAVHRNLIES